MAKANRYGIFDDAKQAYQHLYGRYVTMRDKVGRVTQVFDDPALPKCQLYLVYKKYGIGDPPVEPDKVDIDNEVFDDFRFDSMGWINHDRGAILMELVPIRQTRHGYGDENVELNGFDKNGGPWISRPDDVYLPELLFSDGFKEMLKGEYPTFDETIRAVLNFPHMQVALSRSYAVQTDVDGYTWCWRGGSRIGMVVDPETIKLGRRYNYLREELRESLVFGEGVKLL